MLDGQEITQFTYFQQAGGLDLFPISGEITYGLERICMFLNDVDNVYDLPWNNEVTYREVRHRDEYEFSKYYFESADTAMYFRMFNDWERESQRLLKEGLVLAAYECCLKCSHTFNILDARGAISVTERAQIIGRVRGAGGCGGEGLRGKPEAAGLSAAADGVREGDRACRLSSRWRSAARRFPRARWRAR